QLIDQARASGADALKLQTLRADTITTRSAIFDMENTGRVPQHALFRQYELDEAAHRRIFDHAAAKGMVIFSTPSHATDVDLLERFDPPAYKIGSDDA